MEIKLSVIIPTLNRAELLNRTLQSLSNQTLSSDDYEIIIIDNGSIDNTKEICDIWKSKFKNYIYIYDNRPGLHIGRNRGYLESRGDILVYGDDDIEVTDTWLETIINGFSDKNTVLIGGSDYPNFEVTPPEWVNELWQTDNDGNKLLLAYSCIDMGNEEKEITPYYVFGCNFAVRKSVIQATEGFHPDGMPKKLLMYRGDGESYIASYIIKNNLKTKYLPGASVKHFVSKNRMTKEYVNGIAYRNGVSDMFTMLRKYSLIHCLLSIIKRKIRFLIARKGVTEQELNSISGQIFLLKKYILSHKVRKWIHLKNYLNAVAL